MECFDAVILGAGAAGMMCALTAGASGKRVLLLERQAQAGKKILISGGGRCNFTNLEIAPDRFLSDNPHFCKSALSRFTQHDFIAMVERHRIAYHEKTLGQLFCDGSAKQITAMLLAECAAACVDLRLDHQVGAVAHDGSFRIESDHGTFRAPILVIASGGLSIPKMGATGCAYEVARRFGLGVIAPRAALVPLTTNGATLGLCRSLTGVSLPVTVSCRNQTFHENLLFTHRGISGPAILQISSYWRPGEPLEIDLAPHIDLRSHLASAKGGRPKAGLKTLLGELMPLRLAGEIAAELPAGPIANLPHHALAHAANRVKHWSIAPSGTEGWAKAEVTAGGIDTEALSSRTMEVRAVPGLFFIGEAVDVTGWLGGYNFQWAWSSGWCAAQKISESTSISV